MWVLELNDAEITLSRDGDVHYCEPGVAMLAERKPAFGDVALAASLVNPRQTQNQYFGRMNAEPVSPGAPSVTNQADLVYQHLDHIKSYAGIGDDDELYVTVPSTSTPEQLSLLLGIAQEAKLPIRTLVDLSVAAACTQRLPEQCKLIDVSLHRALIADLTGGDEVRRADAQEVPETGLVNLLEGWVDAVADRFVAETRFDPLRIAETEQQVFDQIYRMLQTPTAAEAAIEIEHRGDFRRIDVPLSALAHKSEQRYELLTQHLGAPTTLLITHRVARLPGLAQRLEQLGHTLICLPADATRAGVRACLETLRSDDGAVRFISALPGSGRLEAQPVSPHTAGTHLLCGAIATALNDALSAGDHPEAVDLGDAFRIVLRDGLHYVVANGETSVAVNGQALDGEAQATLGDVIVCRGREFRVIRVAGE